MGRFTGKVAIVTGSTRGLGEAIAHRFVDEGAREIVITGRDHSRGHSVVAALSDKGADPVFVEADLADRSSPGRIVAAADENFGRVDVLVNAAAISTRGSIIDASIDVFDNLVAVNVRAPFFLIQHAANVMRREHVSGTIVNIGSVVAHGGLVALAPYAVTKGALVTLTKTAAYALSWDRIRVNVLNLGWMDTPTEHEIQTQVHGQPENWLEIAGAAMPFGRILEPAEVAAAVAFAASDDSGTMSGAVIDFDQSVPGAGPPAVLPRGDRP